MDPGADRDGPGWRGVRGRAWRFMPVHVPTCQRTRGWLPRRMSGAAGGGLRSLTSTVSLCRRIRTADPSELSWVEVPILNKLRDLRFRKGDHMRTNTNATFAKTPLVAVFITAMALSALPSPASSQSSLCGNCANHPDFMVQLHRFKISTWTNRMCDNTGGCHYIRWGTGKCWDAHLSCFMFSTTLDDLESAIFRSDHQAFTDALASSTGWDYDSADRVLSFTSSCSQCIIARYVLLGSFGDIAIAVDSDRVDRREIEERVTHSGSK